MTKNFNTLNIHLSLLPAVIIFVLTANINAQFETATVLGAVRDANEAAVRNATVTLKNIATDSR